MEIPFYKYQATGNDFVMIDEREHSYNLTQQQIESLCHRHFGIGADGLILLQNHPDYDFKMVYYNADGNQSSMCGNGGRCITQFAFDLGMIHSETKFIAVDGEHSAKVLEDAIELQMIDVKNVESYLDYYFTDTGSPHHVEFVDEVDAENVVENGRQIRNEVYGKKGSNVNFVEQVDSNTIKIRTYERGVEDETLSCGTGVTAAAIISHFSKKIQTNEINVISKGGNLKVRFDESNQQYSNIFLVGKAKQVFNGKISI